MPEPLVFSMSQISTYVDCKKKYQLGYEMNLEPKVSDETAMSKGTAFHKQAQYRTTLLWPHLPQIEPPDASHETQDLYDAWWLYRGKEKHEKKKRVLGVEAPLYIPLEINTGLLDQAVYIRCTFDEIYLDKEGWIIGLDYKTFQAHTAWDVDLDFQGRIYLAALQRLFPKYNVRFEYERIRQSAPGTPRGDSQYLRLEEDTWWQYNKAGDKRKRAELWTVEECYETIDLIIDQDEMNVLWEETKFNVMELLVRQKASQTMPGAWGRTTNKGNCSWCYFKTLCKSDLQGTLDEQTIELLANVRKPMEIPPELRENGPSI